MKKLILDVIVEKKKKKLYIYIVPNASKNFGWGNLQIDNGHDLVVIGSFSSFDLVQRRIDCLNISIGNALIMVFPHTDQRTISILTDYTGKYLCFT